MYQSFSSRSRYRSYREAGRGGRYSGDAKKDADDAEKPIDKVEERQKRRAYIREYLTWLRPYWPAFLGILVLALIGVGLGSIKPLISAYMVDGAIMNESLKHTEKINLLGMLAGLMIGAALLGVVLNVLRSLWITSLNARVVVKLRQRLHNHLMHLPLSELSEMKAGGITSRLSGDLDKAMGLAQTAVISPTVATIQAIVAGGIIFWWNWKLALATMSILPLLVLIHLLWLRKIRPIYRSVRDDRAAVDARVVETFGGIRVVRAFRREPRERLDYAVGHHTATRKSLLANYLQTIVSSGWELLMPGVTITIMWYGGYLVMREQATIGQLFAFQWYVFLLIGPIMRIVMSMTQTQQTLAALERVFDVFDIEEDKPDAPDAIPAPTPIDELAFDHVWFEYREGVPVIEDFDLQVPGGSVVALVGPSGAGKTTMTDLVARFHDPTRGRILLNGTDLRLLQLTSYRSLLAVVQQDVFLFDGTIRDNISYGRRASTEAQIVDAATRANADQFIQEMPDGYDTIIGERGVKLSGGQRQRISIARAILADPQILILDEATSNLDTESEQLIQAALAKLYAGRTTFVIAHRLSTITHADLIVVMDKGRILESGTHADLMQSNSTYRDMVQRQMQSFEGSDDLLAWEATEQ